LLAIRRKPLNRYVLVPYDEGASPSSAAGGGIYGPDIRVILAIDDSQFSADAAEEIGVYD